MVEEILTIIEGYWGSFGMYLVEYLRVEGLGCAGFWFGA